MIFGKKTIAELKDTYDYKRRVEELTFDKKLLRENVRILKASQFNCEIAILIYESTRLLKKYIRDIECYDYEVRYKVFDEVKDILKNLEDYADLLREIDSIVYTIDEEDDDFGTGRKGGFKYLGKHEDDICEEKCCDHAKRLISYDDVEEEDDE